MRRVACGMLDRLGYSEIVRWLIAGSALAMSCYHLSVAFVGPPNALVLRSIHVGFALTLAFLTPRWRKRGEQERPSILDWALIALAVAATAYPVLWVDYFLNGCITSTTRRRPT